MSAVETFRFNAHGVRAVSIDDEPWFVAVDVAAVLGYSATSAMTRSLDEDEKGLQTLHTPGGRQELLVISEPGLFSAILRSRIPEARAFKRWVTHEVLPQIRQTGTFSAAPALPQTYAEALRELAATVEQNAALEARVAEDAPKVAAYDQLMDADGYYSMESAAKMCGVGRTTLYKQLREAGVIQPGSTLPYQKYMHHFVLTASSWTDSEGNIHPTQTTRVRPSGLPFVLRKAGAEPLAVHA